MAHLKMVSSLVLVLLFSVAFSEPNRVILGGWNVKSANDKSVQRVTGKAMNKLGENGVDVELLELCEARSQLVAGVNYKISMIIKNKGSSDDSTNQLCKFQAYERLWEDFLEINDLSCDETQKKCP